MQTTLMSAKILDGSALAQKIKLRLKGEIEKRNAQSKQRPGLDVILVGNNPASQTYVKHKQRACEQVGIYSQRHELPANASQQQIADQIGACNEDPSVHGILLQLPLPEPLLSDDLLELIDPLKDVDGFHPYNLGRLVQRRPLLRPCTPFGIMSLLAETGNDIAGMHAVVVGASNIVGRPMALELLLSKCTTTICHRFTKNLGHVIQEADIVIAATGKPGIIQSDWIKPGAIVIDVGFSRLSNGLISGDIEFETAKQRASWITPVPGGVGPMTVATLLENTLQAAQLQEK